MRDWIDVIHWNDTLQPLGYLAWAACGKDTGFSPAAILSEAARTSRYSLQEVSSLSFDGPPPDAGALSRRWRELLESAKDVVNNLPAAESGRCVLDGDGRLLKVAPDSLRALHDRGEILFHEGSIRGALPRIVQIKDL